MRCSPIEDMAPPRRHLSPFWVQFPDPSPSHVVQSYELLAHPSTSPRQALQQAKALHQRYLDKAAQLLSTKTKLTIIKQPHLKSPIANSLVHMCTVCLWGVVG